MGCDLAREGLYDSYPHAISRGMGFADLETADANGGVDVDEEPSFLDGVKRLESHASPFVQALHKGYESKRSRLWINAKPGCCP